MGFVFRYEAVLRQRRREEERRQRELAEVLRERMRLRAQLGQMQETVLASKRQMSEGLVGKVDPADVSALAQFSIQQRHRAVASVRELARVEQRIAAARGRLLEAARARKTLERLREREEEAWRAEQDRKERAELDDLAAGRFVRQQMEGG